MVGPVPCRLRLVEPFQLLHHRGIAHLLKLLAYEVSWHVLLDRVEQFCRDTPYLIQIRKSKVSDHIGGFLKTNEDQHGQAAASARRSDAELAR